MLYCTWSPSRRANLPVFVSELEGLHQPQRLVNVPPDGQVVHGDLAQHLNTTFADIRRFREDGIYKKNDIDGRYFKEKELI